MRRILLTIEYKGTNYKGWQIQKGLSTVQGEITNVLEKVCRHSIKLHGSGRTDEGVHAIAQTAHFDCDCTIPDDRFNFPCNILLPSDIKIKTSRQVSKDFHARFNVKKKTYLYKMYLSNTKSPLRENLYAHIPYKLDIDNMKKACRYVVGVHDFTSFMASGSSQTSTKREVFSADITQKDDELYFEICGKGFLHNMVRIIVGTLIDIGRGKFAPDDMPLIIESKNRSKAGFTAPPYGLYLKNVEY